MIHSLANLKKSRAYSKLSPVRKLEAMLLFSPFKTLLEEGEILDVKAVARRTGFERQHVYRLIRAGKLRPIERGLDPGEVMFFFLPEQLVGLFH